MRALVTGGAGFIGSHLVELLEEKGIDVVVLDDLSTGRRENLEGTKAKLVVGSIENSMTLESSLQDCSVIFHLAAVVPMLEAFSNPAKFISINTAGTANVLSYAKKFGIEHIVFVSSAAVYGDSQNFPINEAAQTKPMNPYAVSKLAAEQLCTLWANEFGTSITIVRLFNAYGPRQYLHSKYSAVIPSFIKSAKSKKPFIIFGDGTQTRDFIFIKDVVDALWFLYDRRYCGVINLATGIETSIIKLAQIIADMIGVEPSFDFREPRNGDVTRSVADISKLVSLGFKPKVDIVEGLRKTIEAY